MLGYGESVFAILLVGEIGPAYLLKGSTVDVGGQLVPTFGGAGLLCFGEVWDDGLSIENIIDKIHIPQTFQNLSI